MGTGLLHRVVMTNAAPRGRGSRGGGGLVFPLTTHDRDDMWPQGKQVSRQFARAEVDANAEQGKWET